MLAGFAVCLATPVTAQNRPGGVAVKPAPSKTVWPDEGPRTWAPRPTTTPITANDLRTRLYQFADDSMMGRRIGELGNYKGTEYIAREFRRLGLKPGGDNGTYFQVMPYGPLGFDSGASRLIAAGTALAAGSDWIPVAPAAANGLGGHADLTNVPVVFAGRWGDTVALDPAVFRGKVAVFTGGPGAGGGGRGPARLVRCDSLPDRFGAFAAAQSDAAGGGRGGRGGGGEGGDAAVPAHATRGPSGPARWRCCSWTPTSWPRARWRRPSVAAWGCNPPRLTILRASRVRRSPPRRPPLSSPRPSASSRWAPPGSR